MSKAIKVWDNPEELKKVEEAATLIREFAQKQQGAFNFDEAPFKEWQGIAVTMLEVQKSVTGKE